MTAPTRQTVHAYPYLRVILCFALLGGAIGGALLTVAVDMLSGRGLAEGGNNWPGALVFMLAGSIMGLVPAALCGVWLAWRRRCRNLGGIAEAVLAGAVISWLFIWLLLSGWNEAGFLADSWLFFVAGGGSALILALCVLPRSQP